MVFSLDCFLTVEKTIDNSVYYEDHCKIIKLNVCLLKGYPVVSLCPLTANLGLSLSLLLGKTGLAPVL